MPILKLLAVLIFFVGLFYLIIPSPSYPLPPTDSVQSLEEADIENSEERRAYFTNFSREEVLVHYENELQKSFPFNFPSYRVSYPPEDSQTLIRDQTRSVHLPEIIHPFRESVFVNFFEASTAKDAISYKGIPFERKITIRYLPTAPHSRILIILPSFLFLLYLLHELLRELISFTKLLLKK